jgi:Spx/MgsR family transcriptional regulator
MAIKVYGIKNCNTMKKAFDFLQEKGVDYEFIDYKKQKPTADLLEGFLEKTELGKLVNKQGTTFRKMSDDQKVALEKKETAIPILIENSSMIKRPVIVYTDGSLTLGFDQDQINSKISQ